MSSTIGMIDPAEAGRWCAMTILLIAFGGLLASGCTILPSHRAWRV